MWRPCRVLLAASLLSALANAFSFTTGNPTQCDAFSVSWTGGTAPFQLLFFPVFGTPRNISIPDSAFSNGKGSFSTPLPFPRDGKFLATMSDATGFAAGGTTVLLTTGSSLGGSCNTTDPGVDFTFDLNDSLDQCRDYRISGYTGGIQPVTIMAVIPGGQSVVLQPPVGPTSFTWHANIYNGTSVMFIMVDSKGRQGGSSDVKVAGVTEDTTCINSSSPSSTAAPSSPSTTSPSTTTPSSKPSSSSGASTPVGAIAGTVLGALIFLAVTITLGLFFLRRRREKNQPWRYNGSGSRRHSQRLQSNINLNDDPPNPYQYPTPAAGVNTPTAGSPSPFLPYTPQTDPARSGPYSHGHPPYFGSEDQFSTQSSVNPFNTSTHTPSSLHTDLSPFDAPQSLSQATTTPAQRKAAAAGTSAYKPSRFVLHTDIDDTLPPANDEGVIELPPQYTERRGQGASSSSQGPVKDPDLFR